MASRLNKKAHDATYQKLVAEYDENCAECKRQPDELDQPLEIDHIDENRDNWEFPNLQLLCKSCNVSKSNRTNPRRRHRVAETLATDQEGSSDLSSTSFSLSPPATRSVKELAEYSKGDPPMKANFLMEPQFRVHVLELVTQHGSLKHEDVVAAGAEYSEGSLRTARDYLAKMTSLSGQLRVVVDEDGITFVALRQDGSSPSDDTDQNTPDGGN